MESWSEGQGGLRARAMAVAGPLTPRLGAGGAGPWGARRPAGDRLAGEKALHPEGRPAPWQDGGEGRP